MAYSDKLIDHYENPRNIGSLDKNSEDVGTGLVGAPACGDVMRLQINGFPDVALAKRRVFHQLPEMVAVAFGRGDGAVTFHDKQPVFFALECQLIGCAPRYDHVIAVIEGQGPVHGTQRARAFVNEDHLVGVGIFVIIAVHAFPGCGQYDLAVAVYQYRFSRLKIVIFRFHVKAFQTPVFQLFVVHGFGRDTIRVAYLDDLRRRVAVVQQRVIIAESFGAEKFFVVKRSVRFPELGMAFGRYFSKSVVMHDTSVEMVERPAFPGTQR